MDRNVGQALDDLRIELAAYVAFCRRYKTPISFSKALLGHREMIRECYQIDPDTFRTRLELLDRLCVEEGVA